MDEYGKRALEVALELWGREIVEPTRRAPRDCPDIDDMIQGPKGLGWSWSPKFRKDGDFEWCGAFAARCWGDMVQLDIRRSYFASTYRLWLYARYQLPPGKLTAPGRRVPGDLRGYADLRADVRAGLAKFQPRAGDILVVGGSKKWGQHITIVERYDEQAGVLHTVEGNATGEGPSGKRYQGVIRRTRTLAECRHIYRPARADLMGAGNA